MALLSTTQLNEALDKSPSAVRVTEEMIRRRIKREYYTVLPDSTTTICSLTLDNGFSVRGESACVDPANFNVDIGQTIAFSNAFEKLWPLFGFLVCEMKHIALGQDAEAAHLRAAGQNDGL